MAQEVAPDIKASIKYYWQDRSRTYDKFPASRAEAQEREAFKLAFRSVFNRNKLNILDVGTGTGFLALLLAEMGHKLTGLDLTEGMMERAKAIAGKSGLPIRFELGDAENLPFDDGAFDAVVCRYCLWTLPEPHRAIREWVRVIKPGGQVAAIEGQWRDYSLKGRLKRLSRTLGILIHERANPWRLGYNKETHQMLPFRDGLSPECATELFEGRGLANVFVHPLDDIGNIRRQGMPLMYRLAMPPPVFLIQGKLHGP
ncbi:MAG: methyltransferase domain-containing protein [Chloroflexota bacterium]|nr:methyltransferase domain-containing protein [Chloroflexota bacterium]